MRIRIICFLMVIAFRFGFSQSDLNTNILFIGNSLTYTNDLPNLVIKEAKGKNIEVKIKMIAHPNYGLEDHWNDGKVQQLIEKNKFDFVIIQQGPSSQTYGKKSLLTYGKKLKKICAENNSELVYFMVWPSRHYYRTFDGVIKNYTYASKRNDALLAPVGVAWKTHFDTTNDFSYYGNDGFHPSVKGSKRAAEIIVKTLFSD